MFELLNCAALSREIGDLEGAKEYERAAVRLAIYQSLLWLILLLTLLSTFGLVFHMV